MLTNARRPKPGQHVMIEDREYIVLGWSPVEWKSRTRHPQSLIHRRWHHGGWLALLSVEDNQRRPTNA
ncbi:MAG: hypothetical protein V2A79_14815 [Planctomycetota bacterium]